MSMGLCARLRALVLCVVFFPFFTLAGCGPAPREMRVGVLAVLDGDYAADGRDIVDAATLAVKEVNSRGGLLIKGRHLRVRLCVEDDKNTPETAIAAARALIFREKVSAIIGPQFSGTAIPVARLAEQSRVLMIAPLSTNPETTAGKRFVFRIPSLDTFQGAVLARFARASLRVERAAVLYDVAASYNRTIAEVFRSTFETEGGKIVAFESYTTDRNTDYSEQLARIKGGHPQILFLPNYSSDVRIQAGQARALGISAVLLGGDGWGSSLSGESLLDGSYKIQNWHSTLSTPQSQSFLSAYREACGRDPNDISATTYDALKILFAGMQKADSIEAEDVQKRLHGLRDYEGVTGRIEYGDGGDPIKSAVIVHFQGKEARVYAIVEH